MKLKLSFSGASTLTLKTKLVPTTFNFNQISNNKNVLGNNIQKILSEFTNKLNDTVVDFNFPNYINYDKISQNVFKNINDSNYISFIVVINKDTIDSVRMLNL